MSNCKTSSNTTMSYNGEMEVRDTFSARQLSDVPKFLQKRRKEADNEVST